MKKIKILAVTEYRGKKLEPGMIMEVDDHIADRLLKLKLGEIVSDPKPKVDVPKTHDVPQSKILEKKVWNMPSKNKSKKRRE